MNPERHDLIYLDPTASFTLNSCHEDRIKVEEQLRWWLGNSLPCILTRQIPEAETIQLGVPLFFANKKHRICLRVEASAISQRKPLPALVSMQEFFFHHYAVSGLVNFLAGMEDKILVYGSFLMHYLSGITCVRPDSDLDLLIEYPDCSLGDIQQLVARLTKKTQRLIDGEVRFKRLGDIPIGELLDVSAQKLLCKSHNKVELIERTKLYEYYPLL